MNAVEIYENAFHKLDNNEITIGEFKDMILPLEDVEVVIRCKDCKYLVEIDADNLYVCDRIDIGMDGEPCFLSPEKDFCSRGDRRGTNG